MVMENVADLKFFRVKLNVSLENEEKENFETANIVAKIFFF